jgi:citrate synthase
MGAWLPKEGRVVLRGKTLFDDLKDTPWTALVLYAITGRMPSAEQVQLFEGLWSIGASYPDPRIWNNRVAALAGTTRSTATLAVSAANAVSEATIYGHRPLIRAIDFLYRTRRRLDQGADLPSLIKEELDRYRIIPGYGRPAAYKDERLEPLQALAARLGFSPGPYTILAFDIDQALTAGHYRIRMNAAALAAGLVADQGLSPHECYHYGTLSFSAGILACYVDSNAAPEGTLFPLRCTRINYNGAPPRDWTQEQPNPQQSPSHSE